MKMGNQWVDIQVPGGECKRAPLRRSDPTIGGCNAHTSFITVKSQYAQG